jgi:hypothetical protein
LFFCRIPARSYRLLGNWDQYPVCGVDVRPELMVFRMTKCSHDLCLNEAEPGSQYCNECIQLPTRECNFCHLAEMTDNRRIADEIQRNINRAVLLKYLIIILIVILFFIGIMVVTGA